MSMSTSGGVGGGIGGPQQPLPQELEATSATVNAKAQLGLTQDSLVRSFVTTKDETYRNYQASPGRPTIAPLFVSRNAIGGEEKTDDTWKGAYAQLAERLGLEIKERLDEENKLPIESRDPTYLVLDSVLTGISKAIIWLEGAAAPVEVDSPQFIAAQENLAMTKTVWTSASDQTKTLLGSMGPYLKRDRLTPDLFDANVNMMKQIALTLRSMGRTYDGNITEKGIDPQTRSSMIAQNMVLQGDQFSKIDFGNDMTVIRQTWNTLTTIAAAQSLDPGPRSVMLGLSMAMSGVYTSDSPTGFIGPALQSLIHRLSEGITSTFAPNTTEGGRVFFNQMITLTLIASLALSGSIARSGLGSTNADELNTPDAKGFTFDLVMHLVNSSNILGSLFQNIGQNIRANDEVSQVLANILPMTHTIMMLIYGGNLQGQTGNLINSMNDSLLVNVNQTGETINQATVSQATEEGTQTQANPAEITLQQISLALEDQDAKAFMDAIDSLLDELDISYSQLNKDFNQVNQTATSIYNAFASGVSNQANLTGVTHAA